MVLNSRRGRKSSRSAPAAISAREMSVKKIEPPVWSYDVAEEDEGYHHRSDGHRGAEDALESQTSA
jgi:hypothetical protein